MVENIVRQTTKKTWYKWSLYVNIILFFVVAVMLFFVIMDSYYAGMAKAQGDNTTQMFVLIRDIAILVVAIALLFFQFFKNLFTIMKRSL